MQVFKKTAVCMLGFALLTTNLPDGYAKGIHQTLPITRKTKDGRLVVTKEPQHASRSVLDDQLIDYLKATIKSQGTHANHSPLEYLRNIN